LSYQIQLNIQFITRSHPLNHLIQRKTGGQPGNQNARKHGFYSKALTHEEKLQFKDAVDVDGLDQEIAILRVKFKSLVTGPNPDLRLINETAETLAKLYHIKFILSRNDSAKLKEAVASVLEEFIIPDSPSLPLEKGETLMQ
jgi:hypothetical protein